MIKFSGNQKEQTQLARRSIGSGSLVFLEETVYAASVMDGDGRLCYVNTGFCDLLGRRQEDLLGRFLPELFSTAEVNREPIQEFLSKLSEQQHFGFRLLADHSRSVEIICGGYAVPKGEGFCVLLRELDQADEDVFKDKEFAIELARLLEKEVIG